MPDLIDTTDGVSSAIFATDAWHHLGTVMGEDFTAEQAMVEGHLGGWDVRKVPAFYEVAGQRKEMPGRYAVVRDNPIRKGQIDFLGDVGETWNPIQNEEHAGFLNALTDEAGASLNTAGSLNGGKLVFVTMKLPGHITIGGVDRIDNFIATVNSNDGSMSYTTMITPVQVVCANTLNMAFNNHSNIFRVRHTSGAQKNLVSEARRVLELTFDFLEGFQEQADQLINTAMTQTQFEAIIEAEFGAPEDASPATVTRADAKIEQMAELFGDAKTQATKRNTAWGGLSALTEWNDHFAPTRGEDRDLSRYTKAILDPDFKNRALKLMLAAVK